MYYPIIKYGLALSIATLSASKILEYKMMEKEPVIEPPADTVSIIVPSLNEEMFIEQCLSSLREQSISKQYPEYFEYILVDNGSYDNTVELAKPYVDKILVAPKGKLNARNLGTLNSKGNIIVSVDSDITFPPHWLNSLLKPFNDTNVAGVSGSIIDSNFPGTPKSLYIIGTTISHTISTPKRMPGGNCAYLKHLFYLTGQFNTNINQTDVKQMIQEEELGFGQRLSQYGKIVYKHNAPGIHLGAERIACRKNLLPQSICKKYRIGIERFG